MVLYLRHRRLQHSFTAFANSHYNSRLGSAIFSSGDELGKTSLTRTFHEISILLQCTAGKCNFLQLTSLQFSSVGFSSFHFISVLTFQFSSGFSSLHFISVHYTPFKFSSLQCIVFRSVQFIVFQFSFAQLTLVHLFKSNDFVLVLFIIIQFSSVPFILVQFTSIQFTSVVCSVFPNQLS